MLGDHGPFFYEIWARRGNFKYYNTTKEEYLLDKYNVLAAIRWPEKVKPSQDIHFIPEVFQLVFAALSKKTLQRKSFNVLFDRSNVKYDISDWEINK